MAGFRQHTLSRMKGFSQWISPRLLQKVTGQNFIHPFYHAISDIRLPHISNLYKVKNTKQFIQDLDFLLKYYSPIDLDEFMRIHQEGIQIKKSSFLLSFDDGLKEFEEVIAPILLQKGVPAICFLNSAFVDNRALFFRYKASLLYEHISENKLEQHPIVVAWVKKLGAVNNVSKGLMAVDYNNEPLLDELADSLGLSFQDFLKKEQPYLTSDSIRSLIDKGFFFGAHSIDHPFYHKLNLEAQLKQTKESMLFVQSNFKPKYKVFSFPFTDFGVRTEYFEKTNQSGLVDVSFGTAGQKYDSAPNHFQRIPFEMSECTAKQIHNSELLYFAGKSVLGKNRIRRD